jgi:hypothetical protein
MEQDASFQAGYERSKNMSIKDVIKGVKEKYL